MTVIARLRSARLDQRILWQRKFIDQDADTGVMSETWVDLMKSWAGVDGAKANAEPFIADGIRSVSDYTVWIRADVFDRCNLTVADRAVWLQRNTKTVFDIKDIPNQQLRGRFIAVICTAGLNQG